MKRVLMAIMVMGFVGVAMSAQKADTSSKLQVDITIEEELLIVAFEGDTIMVGLNDDEIEKHPATAYSIEEDYFTASVIYKIRGEDEKYDWHTFVFDRKTKEYIGKRHAVIDSAAIKGGK